MTNYKKPHYMTFGPPIPIIPRSHFSKLAEPEALKDAWTICGPSAELNMRRNYRGQCLEMWQVIAAAYLEGLNHGSGLQAELDRRAHDRSSGG